MDRKSAAESLAFDGNSYDGLDPSWINTPQSNRAPPNRNKEEIHNQSAAYHVNGDACYNSARFGKLEEQCMNDREKNYFAAEKKNIDEQQGRRELVEQQKYYPPISNEVKNVQNNVTHKTTTKSQPGNEEYYSIGDYKINNSNNFKEADLLYAKQRNDGTADTGYYFIERKGGRHKGEEQVLNDPVYFGESDCSQDDEEQYDEKCNFNESENYAFASPDEQFFSRHYSSPRNRQINIPMTYDHQLNRTPSKTSSSQSSTMNELHGNRRKESIYREVLKTIDETVSELKDAALEDDSQYQASLQNLDQIQRYRSHIQDKFDSMPQERNSLNKASVAGVPPFILNDHTAQRNLEQKASSELDSRNEYRRQSTEPNVNTHSEPHISPFIRRRFDDRRSPVRQSANRDMFPKFQNARNTTNQMAYRHQNYYNMKDQGANKSAGNVDDTMEGSTLSHYN